MIQSILPGLFLGDQDACIMTSTKQWDSPWVVLHACKEPCHRRALGYTGRAPDPDHPGYLHHQEHNNLYLNLVDTPDPRFFSVPLMSHALDYLSMHHMAAQRGWQQVLVHCNQGRSRSAGLLLLYLFTRLATISTYSEAKARFVKDYYPGYQPGTGLEQHLLERWPEYVSDGWRKSALSYSDFLPGQNQGHNRNQVVTDSLLTKRAFFPY